MNIRIYTHYKGYWPRIKDSRVINLNQGELTEIISKYIEEQYLKEDEILRSIEYDYT